ncbi:MAG: hypothetical protein HYY35_03940 [Deltaproteobacteria bacterium]|nr:hypothetical protein [Deltaproteobacteria bacterium]
MRAFEAGAASIIRSLWADRRVRTASLAILAVSVTARLVLVAFTEPVLVSDARDYWVYAYNLAHLGRYVQVYDGETLAFNGYAFWAYRPPGYPGFLSAFLTVFDWEPRAALVANVFFDAVSQLVWLLIASAVVGRGPALIAMAMLGAHLLWTPFVMSESFFTALFSIATLAVVFRLPLISVAHALFWGTEIALALFTRPIALSLAPATLHRFLGKNSVARGAMILVLFWVPSLVATASWTLRNYALFRQPVILTTNLGSHNAADFGIDMEQVFGRLREAGLDEAQIDSLFLDLERRIAVTRGVGWCIRLWGRRLADLVSLTPARELRSILWVYAFSGGPVSRAVGWLHEISFVQYYATYALAAVGIVVLLVARVPLAGLWTVLVCYLLVHPAMSRGDIRLFAPLYPLVALFAAVGCHSGFTLLKTAASHVARLATANGAGRRPFRGSYGKSKTNIEPMRSTGRWRCSHANAP